MRTPVAYLGLYLSAVAGITFCQGLTACRESDDEVTRFLSLSYSEQQMALSTLPLNADRERQVHVYLEARKRQNPTNPALAEIIARGGAEVVPILTRRLKNPRDDADVVNLLEVFQSMQLEDYYCVRCDTRLMAVLHQAVPSVGPWRKYAEDIIESIVVGEAADPSTYSR